MPKLFISYRRSDTQMVAGRLREALAKHCGDQAIFRDKDKIHTTTETTEKGVAVVQTSDDPKTVAALQTHAAEVSDLVQGGMAALHTAMMRNGGGMLGGGMMGNGAMYAPMLHGGMHGPM